MKQLSKIVFVFLLFLGCSSEAQKGWKIKNGVLTYNWSNVVPGFNMPVKIYNEKGNLQFIYPKEKPQHMNTDMKELKIDDNFYILTNQIN